MRDWDSNRKGHVAEKAIELAAGKRGVEVYLPTSGHSRTDMVFQIGGQLLRIQCKWARLTADGACVAIQSGGFRMSYGGNQRTTYSEEEIDYLAAYAGELDRCFLLPPSIFAGKHAVQLRLAPTRNNQQAYINLADDYDFDGAVAQLEERRHGMAEARGSSPLSSTSLPSATAGSPRIMGLEQFRDTLGQVVDQVAFGQEIIVTRRGQPQVRMLPA